VEEGYDVRVGLQCLEPLMTLKSIRNIYAVSLTAVDEGWEDSAFRWMNPHIKSPLTRVEFASCCMNAVGIKPNGTAFSTTGTRVRCSKRSQIILAEPWLTSQ
jgi:hypothetical protein